MIAKECKRLAEVDFPIAVVSRHSARDKSIRHGHPSTLHLWWARRPLAACRAMLLALLLPDPCDPKCPDEFKQRARNILPRVQGTPGANDIDLRNELLRFIGDFADWDNSDSPVFLEAARGLVRSAHGNEPPLVVDPFAGGGSIPLEALRIGCDAFASDLNPVACLILKTLLEDIPRLGSALGNELRTVGAEIKLEAEKELAPFYPPNPDGSKPIAYLWARTITCDTCGAEIPMVRSFWLSTKPNRKRALRYSIIREKGKPPTVVFEVFQPKNDAEVPRTTVSRAKAACPACNSVMLPARLRIQMQQQRGGGDVQFDSSGKRSGGAILLAVVSSDKHGRSYRVAAAADYAACKKAHEHLASIIVQNSNVHLIPNELVDPWHHDVNRLPMYGMPRWGDVFTARQKLLLLTLLRHIRSADTRAETKAGLALALSKLADKATSICRWKATAEYMAGNSFSRQALSLVWDFCEAQPFGGASGGWEEELNWVAEVMDTTALATSSPGQTQQGDATSGAFPDGADVWFTDPPYYDAIDYAHCSDFFYVWLKRTLAETTRLAALRNGKDGLTPKDHEIVVDSTTTKGHGTRSPAFYEEGMAEAFRRGRAVLSDEGVASVVFAHKTTEGWESLLSGMVQGGWTVTGSWPIATEMSSRLRARDSAALATSVHLVCRPRLDDAPVGDWADVLRQLPQRVGDWIERLQAEGIKGADLVFACIGPAMEIYSRYRRVEDAEGREIPLGGDPSAAEPYKRGFLAYVWETVGRLALEEVLGTAEARARNGGAGALEEDSRLTALFLWTLQVTDTESDDAESSGEDDQPEEDEDDDAPKKKKIGYSLIYDVARRFAQPLGIHLDKWEGRIIETEKGVVRLIPVTERASQLFGEEDAAAISRRIEADVKASRNYTFAFMQDIGAAPEIKTRTRGRKAAASSGVAASEAPAPQVATTLDRLHAAMLLQRGGQTNGLRAMLREETQCGPDFLRLANALSRLYPKDSEEKRLLDAMLLAVPR
jgi:adenine-specific DNA methylase